MELLPGSCKEISESADPRDCLNCSACGFIHLVNRPTQEQLDKFYRDEFFQIQKPKYAQEEQEDIVWHRMLFTDRLEDFTDLLGRKPESVLDIGCGTGLFLQWLITKGLPRCIGVDISPFHFPGLDVFQKLSHLSESTRVGTFDIVCLHFVLEHVLNPEAMIREAAAHLKPDGVLYVCCPNDFIEIQYLAATAIGKPFYWVHVPDHVNYFNFDLLERVLLRCELTPVLRDATFPMEGFLTSCVDYTSNLIDGRRVHHFRMLYEIALNHTDRESRRLLMHSMAVKDKGRDCIIYARRF